MKKIFEDFSSELGNVVIEFTLTAVALFVPIAYISVATTQVALSYIEVQDAARAGARLLATSEIEASGRAASLALANSMLSNSNDVEIAISCSKNPCLARDGIVSFQINQKINLSLPLIPYPISITVSGAQAEVVQDSE